MMPAEVRTLLVRFREALEHSELPIEEAVLANDLVGHLIELQENGRLTAPFLKLALEPFQDVPQIARIAGPLVRFATHQSAAMGHREFQRSDALPWISSSHAGLEVKRPLKGFTWPDGPDAPE